MYAAQSTPFSTNDFAFNFEHPCARMQLSIKANKTSVQIEENEEERRKNKIK